MVKKYITTKIIANIINEDIPDPDAACNKIIFSLFRIYSSNYT